MDKQEAFNRYLSNSRTLFSRTARVTRRRRVIAATLVGMAVTIGAALCPAFAADEMVIRTMGPVSYVCGGIAADERAKLAAQEKNFNIGVLFTQGDGEYLSDVDVKMTLEGQPVANFKAGGPRCLIRAPEGSYNIEASYKGQTKSIKITAGTRNAQLRW